MDRARYLLGILTLLLAVAGGSYLFRLLGDEDKSRFFRVEVELANVEGLLPGADVKYRGVGVGSVRHVALRDDGRKGIAVVVLNPGGETLARTNTKFWIVTPRFGGIAGGASGLETLVRDAYVAFFTPEPWEAQLANGSTVAGLETPWVDEHESPLPAPRRGDLLMTLLVPENHGLAVGSPVRFRGVPTGEVRAIELANDGTHVRIALRIDRRHRGTVTDKTSFWVARPRLSGALLRGISLDDLSAILSPFVSYHSVPGEGLPVPDGLVVAAEAERPTLEMPKVDAANGGQRPLAPAPAATDSRVQVVRVLYEALEEDWLSPDDHLRRDGSGVLFEDRDGRLLVLTARSLCDASYFERDTFGALPDVKTEGLSIALADGTVVRAMRTWVAEAGRDLALLTADLDASGRQGLALTDGSLFAFDVQELGDQALALRAVDSEHRPVETPLVKDAPLPSLATHRGAVAVLAGTIVGILGQRGATDETAQIWPVSLLPAALRPRS